MSARAAGLAALYLRDLDRLRDGVAAYPSDEALWLRSGAIPNAGGTLALHLAGNLRHFLGAILGGDGYVRDREREFGDREVGRADLLAEIAAARAAVERVLPGLERAALDAPWAGPGPLGEGATTWDMLVHLYGHLGYHLGQLDYHRRMLAPGG
jgi:hypothetical protein